MVTTAFSLSLPAERHRSQDFEEIFSRYADPIYRYLYGHVGNREDAEDLTSDVFLKAAKQLDRQRSEASIASWLFTVARTSLADHWRRYYQRAALFPPVSLDMEALPE